MKKAILRTCIITHEKCEKKDLLRVVRTPDNEVVYDEKGKVNGKGAYLKKDAEVILKAKKTKALDHHLEVNVPDSLYDKLIEVVNAKTV